MSSQLTSVQKKVIRVCGIISTCGAILFAVNVLVLGFVQPGYNHLIDTISVLVLGKYGWVQDVNFGILAFSFSCLGFGIGMLIHKKVWNTITLSFIFITLCLLLDIIFKADPIDRSQIKLTSFHSQEGMIHLAVTFIMIILIPILFIHLIKMLMKHSPTRSLGKYTIFVIGINAIGGVLWFYCRYYGIGFELKGIWQKGIVLNVLIWMAFMGRWIAYGKITYGIHG